LLSAIAVTDTRSNGQVMKGNRVTRCESLEIRVIGGDARDIYRQLTAFPTEQQIVQAVPVSTDHEKQPRTRCQILEARGHFEFGARAFEIAESAGASA